MSRRRLIFTLKVGLALWLKHGIQWLWLDQYMKFGPVTAWKMAGYIWDFRRGKS
jgi:hypothetical protein